VRASQSGRTHPQSQGHLRETTEEIGLCAYAVRNDFGTHCSDLQQNRKKRRRGDDRMPAIGAATRTGAPAMAGGMPTWAA
jgi:hypothetical protein